MIYIVLHIIINKLVDVKGMERKDEVDEGKRRAADAGPHPGPNHAESEGCTERRIQTSGRVLFGKRMVYKQPHIRRGRGGLDDRMRGR